MRTVLCSMVSTPPTTRATRDRCPGDTGVGAARRATGRGYHARMSTPTATAQRAPAAGPGHLPSPAASGRPSRILVDLDAIAANLRAIAAHVRVPVMPIVKANAYGHGLVPVARHLQAQGADRFGVAFVEEGIALREAGISVPILVLGGIFGRQVEQFLRHDLELTVSSIAKLRQVEAAAEAMGRRAAIHLKIDTGMGRIGVHHGSVAPFVEAALASRWCAIRGIYSHLACADDPD